MPGKRELYIIFFILLPECIYSQYGCIRENFQPDDARLIKDSLECIHGFKKTFLPGYELPAILALSCYPELDSINIELKSRKLNHLGNARPKMDFIFRNKENRHYIIIINKDAKDILGFAFSDLPFNAQIGFFGHELAHITDYTGKNNFQMISFGVKYFFMRKAVERYTDHIAIKHNLGRQIYDLRSFVLNNPDIDDHYLKYKSNNYLDGEEILHEISKFNYPR
jgi:hypothetical protein